MTFGSYRKALGQTPKDDEYELLRFCNKLNTSVIGGASRLFTYFKNNYNPIKIISYASLDRSNGNLYDKLGFTLIGKSKPNFYWIIDNIREYRFKYRKDILVKSGHDKNMTAIEIMHNLDHYRTYDSGNLKYEYISLNSIYKL